MQTQQRRPQQPVPASKKNAEVTSKSQPVRTVPATLDDKALRQVGGGITAAPHGSW